MNTWPYFYKFFANDDLRCTHASTSWNRRGWMPKIKGTLIPCQNGYHCITPDGLLDWLAPVMWRVEVRGDWIWKDEGMVVVVREAQLHSPVKQWNEKNQRLIAAEFAQWAVNRYWIDKSDARPQQAIDAARKRAMGESVDWSAAWSAARSAAWSAARSAARSAAGSAAWSAAGSAAASAAWSAAWSAAGSEAWSAAGSEAWSAAGSEAWSAAGLAAAAELNAILVEWLQTHD